MRYLLAAITYLGYIFVVTLYTLKVKKYLSLPVHLRAEVYPETPGAQGSREKSQYESLDWWTNPPKKNRLRRFWFLFNDYFLLADYFRRNRSYWVFLYPWHIGFITLIAFHILTFFGAVALLLGVPVVSGSPSLTGNFLYSLSLITGAVSFTTGLFGSVGMLITRLTRRDLRDYATPQNYFTYIFLLAVFLSGLYAWLSVDPEFMEYRDFWKGLITLKPIDVDFASEVHILLFALLLIYLPFTRSLHYVTRLFGFLLIRWDDAPNTKGSPLEKRIREMLDQKVNWKGPHIKAGSTWSQLASESKSQDKK